MFKLKELYNLKYPKILKNFSDNISLYRLLIDYDFKQNSEFNLLFKDIDELFFSKFKNKITNFQFDFQTLDIIFNNFLLKIPNSYKFLEYYNDLKLKFFSNIGKPFFKTEISSDIKFKNFYNINNQQNILEFSFFFNFSFLKKIFYNQKKIINIKILNNLSFKTFFQKKIPEESVTFKYFFINFYKFFLKKKKKKN